MNTKPTLVIRAENARTKAQRHQVAVDELMDVVVHNLRQLPWVQRRAEAEKIAERMKGFG